MPLSVMLKLAETHESHDSLSKQHSTRLCFLSHVEVCLVLGGSSDKTYSGFDCGLFEMSAESDLLHALGNRPA